MEVNKTREFWDQINSWRTAEKLKVKEYRILLECYRRVHMFNKGKFNVHLLTLEYPSAMKPAIKEVLLVPSSTETAKVLNWYKLTTKGVKVLKRLEAKWDFKFNQALFEKNEPYF